MQVILATVHHFELTSSHGWEYNEWGTVDVRGWEDGTQMVTTPVAFEYIHYTSDQTGWQHCIPPAA